jgi:OOP family OmpA-OmpF porin
MTQGTDGGLIGGLGSQIAPESSKLVSALRVIDGSNGGAMSLVPSPGRSFMVPVFAVMLLSGATAHAQSVAQARAWTVSPFLGTSVGLDESGAGNSLALGTGVGYDLTSNIGFEAEFSHLFDVRGDDEAIDWSVTNFSANFIYHFDVRRVTPYATFGLGFERSNIAVKQPDPLAIYPPSSTEMAFNFGGGVKYPVTEALLLRGDLRRFEANDRAPDYWRLYAGLTFTLGR